MSDTITEPVSLPRAAAIKRAREAAAAKECVLVIDAARNIGACSLVDVPDQPDAAYWHVSPDHPHVELLKKNCDLVIIIHPPK